MNYNFFIVGGNEANYILAKKIKNDQNNVKILGFEKINDNEIEKANSINETKKDDIIISSIPLSKDGENIYMPYSDMKIKVNELVGKKVIAGKIPKNIYGYDILNDENYKSMNTIYIAETTVKKIMNCIKCNIANSNILILGFNKQSKALCYILKMLGANIYCSSMSEQDECWMKVSGYEIVKFDKIKENICKMDIVINTIPKLIINKSILILMSKDTLIVNLDDNKYIDNESAKKMQMKIISKNKIINDLAPENQAELIKQYAYKIKTKNL